MSFALLFQVSLHLRPRQVLQIKTAHIFMRAVFMLE